MAKIGLIALITIVPIALSFAGCSQGIVSVDHDSGWPWGPDAWNITDGVRSIGIYNGNEFCCCDAGRVADTVAARINRREYDWPIDSLAWIGLREQVCKELLGGSQPANGRE